MLRCLDLVSLRGSLLLQMGDGKLTNDASEPNWLRLEAKYHEVSMDIVMMMSMVAQTIVMMMSMVAQTEGSN